MADWIVPGLNKQVRRSPELQQAARDAYAKGIRLPFTITVERKQRRWWRFGRRDG